MPLPYDDSTPSWQTNQPPFLVSIPVNDLKLAQPIQVEGRGTVLAGQLEIRFDTQLPDGSPVITINNHRFVVRMRDIAQAIIQAYKTQNP